VVRWRHSDFRCDPIYVDASARYTAPVTKRLIDVDDDVLESARTHLGTATIKETVNTALRMVAEDRSAGLADAFRVLADIPLDDRTSAWR